MRVLVVDDDVMQLELIDRALSRDGFEVRCASTEAAIGDAAWDAAIALIDVNMPELPAPRAIELARKVAPAARIVLFSAWEPAKLRALCRDLGADGYVSKSESVFEIGKRLTEIAKAP